LRFVVGIDPGREKCGLALVDADGRAIERMVLPRERLLEQLTRWAKAYGPVILAVGDGTGSKEILDVVQSAPFADLFAQVAVVDEHLSTLEARRRYFAENPPKGWRRLLPVSMQYPPVPFDDYVATILAERYLSRFEV